MRAVVVTLLSIVLLAQVASMIVPWNDVDGSIEWDDGRHIWGRNVHDASDWVFSMDGDDTAMMFWSIGFVSFAVAILFVGFALLTAIVDLRGATLGLAYPAVLLSGAGIAGFVVAMLTDPGELDPKAGLFVAGGMWLVLLIATILGGWIGKSRRQEVDEEPSEFEPAVPDTPFLDEGYVDADDATS